jgi:hypothetical protein
VTLGGNEWGSGGGLVALAVFKTVCDLTFVGLGGFDSHALPPARRSDAVASHHDAIIVDL